MALVSGDILYKSQKSDPTGRGGILEGVGKGLSEFLSEEYGDIDAYFQTEKETIQELRKTNQEYITCKIKDAEQIKAMVNRVGSHHQEIVSKLEPKAGTTGSLDPDEALIRATDQKLLALTVHFYSLVQAELKAMKSRLEEEKIICEELKLQAQASLELEKFGLLLEYQTDRQVLVSKLPQTNPQYIRCRRAALENVRLELFKDTAYSNISVCDVYKIENGILLQQFQQLVKDTPGGKIKGLFCSVPSDSVDHMIVYGMHKSNTVPKETMFPQLWISYPCENQTIQPLVDLDEYQKRLEASKPVPFPCPFSRYSTISQDQNDPEQQLHYLALCRVLVGKVQITKQPIDEFPEDESYDTMYFTENDEYLLRYPQNVLPEFIVQYKYVRSTTWKGSNTAEPIVACDLSAQDVGTVHPLPSTQLNSTSSITTTAFPFSSLPVNRGVIQGRAGRAMRRTRAGGRSDVEVVDRMKRQDRLTWDQLAENALSQRNMLMDAVEEILAEYSKTLRSIFRNKRSQQVDESLYDYNRQSSSTTPSELNEETLMNREELKRLEMELAREKAKRLGIENNNTCRSRKRY